MGPRPHDDLEDRTFAFAQRVRQLVRQLAKTLANVEDARQLVRSSGSVGANYIEANEALGRRDFLMPVRICRKEAQESGYWLRLLDLEPTVLLEAERAGLITEAFELTRIFGAIFRSSDRQEA